MICDSCSCSIKINETKIYCNRCHDYYHINCWTESIDIPKLNLLDIDRYCKFDTDTNTYIVSGKYNICWRCWNDVNLDKKSY